MKVYVVEPCNWGDSFENCHIVAATSPIEALALMNTTEDPDDPHRTDWLNTGFLNVWEVKGITCPALVPMELDLDLVNPTDDDKRSEGPRAEQRLRRLLAGVKEMERKAKEAATRQETF